MIDWPLLLFVLVTAVFAYVLGFRHGMSYQRDVVDEKFQ